MFIAKVNSEFLRVVLSFFKSKAGAETKREQKKNFLQIWREENKKKLMLQKKFLLL
jgi:hypothetical protein